jgi:hypothetical protein
MIIARRTLHWKSQAGAADIEVRIFRPEEIDGCWRCRYEIDWPDRKRAFPAPVTMPCKRCTRRCR